MEELTLKNGLKVIIYPMMNTHSISIGLYIRAGSKYEKNLENGITHFLEHIHFRELDHYSQKDLYYSMESIGSTLRATTYRDFLRFYMKIRPQYFKECLQIFKSILSTDKWSDDAFQKEKIVILHQIEERDSYTAINPLIRSTVFENTNLANEIMGNKDSISHLTPQHLSNYKKKIFNKNNMILYITGPIQQKDILLIESVLKDIPIPKGTKNTSSLVRFSLYNRHPNVILKHAEWDYLDINLSFDLDYKRVTLPEIRLLNCILGEGVGSRLPVLIREELEYTADIQSTIEMYEEFAVLHIRFSVNKDYFCQCLSAIIQLLNQLKNNISFKDLDVSLPFCQENYWFDEDDTEETNFSNAYHSFILRKDSKCNSLNNQNTVNRLMEVANIIFQSHNACLVVLGDYQNKSRAKEILSQLNDC